MMLGQPVALVAELVRAARERDGLLDRTPRVVAADDRGLVEDREAHGDLLPTPRLQHALRLVVALRRGLAQPGYAFLVVARHARALEVSGADLLLRPGLAELRAGEVILEGGVALP